MKLWLAQGGGIGRMPFAPGTFGSVLGLGWLALLLWPGSWWIFATGNLAAIAISVWLCGEGEKILQKKDPSSVVLDEIVAIPICFTTWLAVICLRQHHWPGPAYFVAHWPLTVGEFALFRFFDVLKPWPVSQSQSLPGGWGITIDDVLAAVYVNLVSGAYLAIKGV
ncbi:MAG TPA: phosphatidylglycerophosphatase A [Candidatus Saccharimonadales bacterium]|nr:phosphatidylglycerophosphatase A [Candidatus Saccharimonadales bacterium]